MTNKTQPTAVNPRAYLETVSPQRRREDSLVLMELMERISGKPAVMWGPSMIGFGKYSYTYESGHSGEFFVLGFAPRKTSLVIYLMGLMYEQPALLKKLGKHKMGKSCLYVNKLSDINIDILTALLRESKTALEEKYSTE